MWWLVLGAIALAAATNSGGPPRELGKHEGSLDEEDISSEAAADADQHLQIRVLGMFEVGLRERGVSWRTRRRLIREHRAAVEGARPEWNRFFQLRRDRRVIVKYEGDLQGIRPPRYVIERRPTLEEQIALENRARVSKRIERIAADRRAAVLPTGANRTQQIAAVDEWERRQHAAHARFDQFQREALEAHAMHAALVRQKSPAATLQFTHAQLEQHREQWTAFLATPSGRRFNTSLGVLGEVPDWPLEPPALQLRSPRRPTVQPMQARVSARVSQPEPAPVSEPELKPDLPESWRAIWSELEDGVIGYTTFRRLGELLILDTVTALGSKLPEDMPDRAGLLDDTRRQLTRQLEMLANGYLEARARNGGVT